MAALIVTGTQNLIVEGARALEALVGQFDFEGDDQLAEFRLFENMPIKAIIHHGFSITMYAWTGETWEVRA